MEQVKYEDLPEVSVFARNRREIQVFRPETASTAAMSKGFEAFPRPFLCQVYQRRTFPFKPSRGPSPTESRLSTPAISQHTERYRSLGVHRPHVLTTPRGVEAMR